MINILKKCKKELVYKIISSIFVRGLVLVIPVYWSNTINHVTDNMYEKAIKLVVVTLLLTLMYYIWNYINQRSWYNFYNKLYLEYTSSVIDANIKSVSLGEYTNIINNDIDIIGTFIGNLVTRIIQILEFLVIYIYFFSINKNIFMVTVLISIIMLFIILYFGNKIEVINKKRKDNLDLKTMNIHNIYDILKHKEKIRDKTFIESTIDYLKANAKFNILAQAIIYLVLALIEICRYLIIIYSIHLVSTGNMEIGTILLIYSYYANIISNFQVLGTISAEYQSVKVSISRLNKIKKQEPIN